MYARNLKEGFQNFLHDSTRPDWERNTISITIIFTSWTSYTTSSLKRKEDEAAFMSD